MDIDKLGVSRNPDWRLSLPLPRAKRMRPMDHPTPLPRFSRLSILRSAAVQEFTACTQLGPVLAWRARRSKINRALPTTRAHNGHVVPACTNHTMQLPLL